VQLVEVESDGEAWSVADEEASFAIEDFSTRPGNYDAALALHGLAIAMGVGAPELLIAQARDQDEQHEHEDALEEPKARIVAAVGLDKSAGAVGWRRGVGHGSGESIGGLRRVCADKPQDLGLQG
jgi:hypothetical protein